MNKRNLEDEQEYIFKKNKKNPQAEFDSLSYD